MKRIVLFIVVAMMLCGGVRGQQKLRAETVPTGFEAMAKTERLPLLFPSGTKKNRILTYDASGGNGFGLFQAMFKKYVDEKGEIIFFDAFGPGCLYREQMNIWTDNGVGKNNKNIRIKFYFDGEETPRIDVPVFEFFNGEHAPVTPPFAFRDRSMFGIGYYPFAFEKRLKITLADTVLTRMVENNLETSCNWFQFDYLTFPTGTKVKTWTAEADAYEKTVREQWENLGQDPKNRARNKSEETTFSLRPGESKIAFEHKGKASVAGIQLKMDPFTAETFCKTNIQIWWDDQTTPAVDMPVSYFFGAGAANDGVWNGALKNLLFGFDAKQQTVYCYWPMPFWKKATIKLVNNSSEQIESLQSKVTWNPASAFDYPEGETGYFKAKLTKDSSTGGLTRKNFTKPYANAFSEKGYGHLVAINMWSGNFYEDGDEFTYIDGSRTPQIHGDGTEDDFNQGWAGGRHQKALWGALDNGVKGSCRIHLNEPYIFYDSIDMRFEYTNSIYRGESPRKRAGTDNSTIETEFVAWYYHSPQGSILTLTDSLNVGNAADEKAHAYRVAGGKGMNTLTQGYDSYESKDDYDVVTDNGRTFDQNCEFTVKLDPKNKGMRLRSRIDRTGNGLQRAVVYVNGERLPLVWDISTYSEQARRGARTFDGWFDSEYEIPALYTKGKKQVDIRIEHLQSLKNELNSYRYWAYCYR